MEASGLAPFGFAQGRQDGGPDQLASLDKLGTSFGGRYMNAVRLGLDFPGVVGAEEI
jgi:hypothetical protein